MSHKYHKRNEAKHEAETESAQEKSAHTQEQKVTETPTEEKTVSAQHVHHHSAHCVTSKKIKNRTAWLVFALGFAGGSLFIDFAQLFAGQGFSGRAISEAQVITYDDATWVRYDEPRVTVNVVTSDDCADTCAVVDELLLQMRRFLPTIEAHDVSTDTQEGTAYANAEHIEAVPAFVFSSDITHTNFYKDAAMLFSRQDDGTYLLNLEMLDVATQPRATQDSSDTQSDTPEETPAPDALPAA